MARRNLVQETFIPYIDGDAYTRSLFLLQHRQELNPKKVGQLQTTFAETALLPQRILDARVGHIAKQRASELKTSELASFAMASAEIIRNENHHAGDLASLGFTWNTPRTELKTPEDISSAAALLLITIRTLIKVGGPTYNDLSDESSLGMIGQSASAKSNWDINHTQEHIWRQLEWAQLMIEALWMEPYPTITTQSREALRLGHLLSAIAVSARPLLR